MKYYIFEILLVIGIIAAILLGTAALAYTGEQKDLALYNNGVCECSGHFDYEQAVGHRATTTYIYHCDGCGKRIEVGFLPEEVNNEN